MTFRLLCPRIAVIHLWLPFSLLLQSLGSHFHSTRFFYCSLRGDRPHCSVAFYHPPYHSQPDWCWMLAIHSQLLHTRTPPRNLTFGDLDVLFKLLRECSAAPPSTEGHAELNPSLSVWWNKFSSSTSSQPRSKAHCSLSYPVLCLDETI